MTSAPPPPDYARGAEAAYDRLVEALVMVPGLAELEDPLDVWERLESQLRPCWWFAELTLGQWGAALELARERLELPALRDKNGGVFFIGLVCDPAVRAAVRDVRRINR